MSYIGYSHAANHIAPPHTREVLTPNGSATYFDLMNDVPGYHEENVTVVVNNVIQEPYASYTIINDASNRPRRLDFAGTALASTDDLYVIHQGTGTLYNTPAAGSVTKTSMATNMVSHVVDKFAGSDATSGNTILQDNQMDVAGDWTFIGTGDINFTSDTNKHFTASTSGTGEIQLNSAERIRLDGTTVLGDNGYLTITDNEIDVSSGDLTIDVAGDIVIDADGDNIDFKAGGNTVSKGVHTAIANAWYWYENNAGGEDSLNLEVKANGESTFTTKDVAGSSAHLNLNADGDINTSSSNITNNVTTDHTMNVNRNMIINVGYSLDIDADTGVKFNTGVGFTRLTPTFNASVTAVAFGQSNKQYLTLTANLTGELRMVFPDTSGNFTLLVKQDATGGRTIAAWKTFDQNIANESSVVWAGGSAPTLTTTANKLDIVSFYWDNDNHIAYGVITKNF